MASSSIFCNISVTGFNFLPQAWSQGSKWGVLLGSSHLVSSPGAASMEEDHFPLDPDGGSTVRWAHSVQDMPACSYKVSEV